MPTTYEPATASVHTMAAGIVQQYYPELKEAEVTFLIQMAHAARNDATGEPKGPAVKLHGYPCCAVVSVVPLKDRAAGLPDVRIVLDGDSWDEWPDGKQLAVLDHEIHHCELVIDDDGAVQADDVGRPKLKLRKHDHEIGAFEVIMERHREYAVETSAAALLTRKLVQLHLPYG